MDISRGNNAKAITVFLGFVALYFALLPRCARQEVFDAGVITNTLITYILQRKLKKLSFLLTSNCLAPDYINNIISTGRD